MPARRRRMRDQRGLTLIEVLVAFLVLFVVTLAVLGMFSLAAAVNSGSFARTDMAYAAEKVVEIIRVEQALSLLTPPANDPTCCPLTSSGTENPVPPSSGCDGFWGAGGGSPSFGAGVYDPNARYTLSYNIAPNSSGTVQWREVTVTVQPKAGGYLGINPAGKAVRYVAQIPGS